jgi:hypothetical protein
MTEATPLVPRRRSEDETALILGISVSTLRRLERAGEIRAFRPSPRKLSYLDPDIAEFVGRRGVGREPRGEATQRPYPPSAA